MTIDIISDLHVDFYIKRTDYTERTRKTTRMFIDNILPDEPGDVLCLAGDISHYNTQIHILFEEFKKIYSEVFYVHGNHEMYLISNSQRDKYNSSFDKIQEIEDIAKATGVRMLSGQVIDISGVKFGGLPGWYSITTPKELRDWKNFMNDAHRIYTGKEVSGMYSYNLRPKADFDPVGFYEEQEKLLIEMESCDVLMSHIAQVLPPDEIMNPAFRGNSSNLFYYVDNWELIKRINPKLYIYGHTHDAQAWRKENTEMICNPYGYPHESRGKRIYQVQI